MTKNKELGSIFIKVDNNWKQKNVNVDCIYQHLCIDWTEFNDLNLQTLLDILAFENKVYL